MRCRLLLAAMMFGLVGATPATLRAQVQDPDWAKVASPEVEAEAKELFQQGREAFKQADWRGALNLFQKSQHLFPTPGTLLNVASCEEKLGLVASAWEHFQAIVTQLPATDPRVAIATERVAALEPRVPRVRLSLVPNVPWGTTVSRNGTEIPDSKIGTDLRLDPGEHEIVVSAPGWPPRKYKLVLREGKRINATLKPGSKTENEPTTDIVSRSVEELSEPEKKPPPAPAPTNGTRIAGFVIGGVGLVGLGIGAATGIMAIAMNDRVEGLCPDPENCVEDGLVTADIGHQAATASTVSLIAGLAAIGGGTLLLVLSGGDEPKSTTAFGPVLLTGGGGIGVRGAF